MQVEPSSGERAKAIKVDVPLPDDVQTRINSLSSELRKDRDREYWFARLNYYWALMLMAITIIASFTAGIGGLFFGLNARLTGSIAALPGLIALAATAIDWQGRANWHYRKRDALDALINQLRYELHVPPSPEDVAAISKARTDLNRNMSAEWEQRLGLDWSVLKQNSRNQP